MKPIMTIFSFLLLSAATLTAQSSDQNILQETFRIRIAVQENNSYQVVLLVDSHNNSHNAAVIDPGELTSLSLNPGAVIDGYFRFETFASEGGLGTTRAYRGKGYGKLRIARIRGGEAGAGQTVQLGLAIW